MKNNENVDFNELTIIKDTHTEDDGDQDYITIEQGTLLSAITKLGDFEFKVYLYLASCRPGSVFALNPEDICEQVGGNTDDVEEGIDGLIEKGYLVPDKNCDSEYTYVQKVDDIIN